MRLAKRTYSLPPDLVNRFEERIAPGERSGSVARLIEEWLTAQERAEIRKQLITGCKEMRDLYMEVDRDWSAVSDEVWREGK